MINKDITKWNKSSNARSSNSRKKIKNHYYYKRGSKKYFLYLQKRFLDYYCLIIHQVIFPIEIPDNFKQIDLVKSDKNLNNLKIFLKELDGKVTFSKNSIIV